MQFGRLNMAVLNKTEIQFPQASNTTLKSLKLTYFAGAASLLGITSMNDKTKVSIFTWGSIKESAMDGSFQKKNKLIRKDGELLEKLIEA